MRSLRLVVVFVLIHCTNSLAAGETSISEVVVDVGTQLRIDGISEIQAINGLVVNGESRMEHIEETRALRPRTTRLYLWCRDLVPGLDRMPGAQRQEALGKLDMDAVIKEYFDRQLGVDPASNQRAPSNGKRHQGGISAQFWQLEQLQAWDARKDVVLALGQPHPRGPEDFPTYARWFTACIREVKRRYPDLGPLHVMLFNEPDYEYPRNWDSRGRDESVQLYIALFRHTAVAIKKEFPEVRLIGPGISKLMNWDTWRSWSVPFLTGVPEADRFNCQPYCKRFSDLLAWGEMLQSTSLRLNGHRAPIVATESNTNLHLKVSDWWLDKHHVDRVQNEADQLIGMLARPDLFAMKHYFFYHYTCESIDMWFKTKEGIRPSPVYWLYWLLRDVRGVRLLDSANSEDAGLATLAAADGTTVTLVLHNRSSHQRQVMPIMRWPTGIVAPTGVRETLRYDPDDGVFKHATEPFQRTPLRVDLAPGELAKLRWVTSPTVPLAAQQAEVQVFRSAVTGVDCRGEDLQVDIPARTPHGPDELAKLRLAVYVDDVLATDRVQWTLNGHAMEGPLTVEDRTQPIISVDTVVPSEWIAANNLLVLQAVPGISLRLMHASIAMVPLPAKLTYRRSEAMISQPAPLAIGLQLPSSIEPGTVAMSVRLDNATDTELSVTPTVDLPDGWIMPGPRPSMRIPGRSSASACLAVRVEPGVRGERFVRVSAAVPGLPVASCRRGTFQHLPFSAQAASKTQTVDGVLGEWDPASFFEVKHMGDNGVPYRTRLAACWDHERLYLALDVIGRPLSQVPEGKSFWLYDTAEFFFDFAYARRPIRDHRCMQTYVTLKDGISGRPRWGNCPNDPNGVFLKQTVPEDYKICVVSQANGFAAEMSFDWPSLTHSEFLPANERFIPVAGTMLGFDAALANQPILGDNRKNWDSPARWGRMRLLAPGEAPMGMVLRPNRPTAEPPKSHFSPSQTKGWSFPVDGMQGDGLHLRSNHARLAAEKPLPLVLDGKGSSIEVEFALPAPKEGQTGAQMRVFLTPDENGTDPFAQTDAIAVVAERHASETKLFLACKEDKPGQWGRTLWQGSMPSTDWPIRIAVHLDQTSYRLGLPAQTMTGAGSLSGTHGLIKPTWAGPLRIGVKNVHIPSEGEVVITDLVLQ